MSRRLLPSILILLAAGAAPALGQGDVLSQINALRAGYGLVALEATSAPEVAAAIARDSGVTMEVEDGSLPPCSICMASDQISVRDPESISTSTELGVALARSAGFANSTPITFTADVRTTLEQYTRAAPPLLSDGATAAVVVPTPTGTVVVVNSTLRPADAGLRLWPAGEIRAGDAVIWGGGGGAIDITSIGGALPGRGGRAEMEDRDGPVWEAGELPVGYGGSYRIRAVNGATLDVRVADRAKGNPAFDAAMRPRDRKLFLGSFRRSHPLNRQLLALIGDRMSVTTRKGGCGEGTSCVSGGGMRSGAAAMVLNTWHVGSTLENRFIMQHEFGHAVMFTGLSNDAVVAFEALLKKTGRYRCTKYAYLGQKGCVPLIERFADEYARWALGTRKSLGGYRTPALLSRAQMTRFLRTWYSLALPLPLRGRAPGGDRTTRG